MQLPKLHGVIGRRLLVNFRIEPDVIQRQLPSPFRPKLHDGHAVAGICLIRLENIRPKRFPRILRLSSETRPIVSRSSGTTTRGRTRVSDIPRRDTGSLIDHWRAGALSR